jgi:hypothetical protein
MVDAIVCCLLDFVSYFVQTKKFENCERFAVFSERKIEEGNAVAVVCFLLLWCTLLFHSDGRVRFFYDRGDAGV